MPGLGFKDDGTAITREDLKRTAERWKNAELRKERACSTLQKISEILAQYGEDPGWDCLRDEIREVLGDYYVAAEKEHEA